MEIIKLKPVFKDLIWGGQKLHETYGYETGQEKTGECWGVAALPNGDCIVDGGEFDGVTLSWLFKNKKHLFGKDNHKKFPLLIKIIDANKDLSIQVHPDDAYAQNVENQQYGKSECWYILDCNKDSYLIMGQKCKTKKEFAQKVEQNDWGNILQKKNIKIGDLVQIDPGTVHAITSGIMLLEIQQSSDLTYRVYDYDRLQDDGTPRELHTKKAIDVINYDIKDIEIKNFETTPPGKTKIITTDNYKVEIWNVKDCINIDSSANYLCCCVLDGTGSANNANIKKGDFFIVPVSSEKTNITGKLKIVAASI